MPSVGQKNGITILTFFFSTADLKQADDEAMKDLLVREHLVTFRGPRRYAGIKTLVDPSANEMYTVNVVLGDEDEVFADSHVVIRQYP